MSQQWRLMTPADYDTVESIACDVHPEFPEDRSVVIERNTLYPNGTLFLEVNGIPAGYCVTHPWQYMQPPSLDTLLGTLPPTADTYYIHDIALLPSARGCGAAVAAVEHIVDHARANGYPTCSLVAVNGSVPFWRRMGFNEVNDCSLQARLASYGEDARYMVRVLS